MATSSPGETRGILLDDDAAREVSFSGLAETDNVYVRAISEGGQFVVVVDDGGDVA